MSYTNQNFRLFHYQIYPSYRIFPLMYPGLLTSEDYVEHAGGGGVADFVLGCAEELTVIELRCWRVRHRATETVGRALKST